MNTLKSTTIGIGAKSNWAITHEYKSGNYGVNRMGGRGASYVARCEINNTHPIFIVRDCRGREVDRYSDVATYVECA